MYRIIRTLMSRLWQSFPYLGGGGGIVWAHEALTGHLTECPEKGERKNNNNRGEQEENRLRLDSAEGRSITHDELGWDTGVCGVGNKKNLYSTNFP